MTDDLDPVALLAGTTPGPWEVHPDSLGVFRPDGTVVGMVDLWTNDGPDRTLIAKAPELASALVEARARIAALEAWNKRYQEQWNWTGITEDGGAVRIDDLNTTYDRLARERNEARARIKRLEAALRWSMLLLGSPEQFGQDWHAEKDAAVVAARAALDEEGQREFGDQIGR